MDPTVIAALLLALPPAGNQTKVRDPAGERSEGLVVLRHCLVDHERSAAVGPALFGILKECLVEPGDEVREGQVMGRLEDEDARAEVQLRETEATSSVDLRLCESRNSLAQNRLKITGSLLKRNAASREEFTQQRLEAEATALEIENARHRRELAEAQLRHARAMLHAREFVSPQAGIVTEVLKRPSEPVAPNLPVFRIVDVDHLLVTGQVDVVDVWHLHAGQAVRIVPEIAGADLALEREVFEGRIFFIDPRVDPVSQTCKVLARCENRRRLLRAGLEVRMEIPTDSPAAPAPAQTETAAASRGMN
jgi:RND family efflux transporter MFP subunit